MGVPTGEVAPRVDAEAAQEAHSNDYVNDVGTLDEGTVSHAAAYRVAPALAPYPAPHPAGPAGAPAPAPRLLARQAAGFFVPRG